MFLSARRSHAEANRMRSSASAASSALSGRRRFNCELFSDGISLFTSTTTSTKAGEMSAGSNGTRRIATLLRTYF